MQTIPTSLRRISFPILFLCLTLIAATGCKKQPPPPPAVPAEGSLQNEVGNCLSSTVHGPWYNGVSADTSYVEIGVAVTKAGSYKIITDKQNGVVFSATGTFTDTGLNKVRLKQTGLFTSTGATRFITAFNSSACQFTVAVKDSTFRDQPDNTWEFTAGGRTYKGTGFAISTLYPGGDDGVVFYGSMSGFSDTSLTISYLISVYDPLACSRLTSAGQSSFHFISSRSATGPMVRFDATQGTVPAVIDLRNCSSNIYYFSGTARDTANNIVPVTNARFRADNPTQLYFP